MLDKLLAWDKELFVYLNSLGIETYDGFWLVATQITTWIPLFIVFLALLFLKFPRPIAYKRVLAVFSLVAFVLVVTYATKLGVGRIRPSHDVTLDALIRVLYHSKDYSFFSGHAASSFAITTIMVLFLRKKIRWVWLFYLWPLIFSASRIYLGVHFPSDILVGALFGFFSAFIFYRLHQRFIVPD